MGLLIGKVLTLDFLPLTLRKNKHMKFKIVLALISSCISLQICIAQNTTPTTKSKNYSVEIIRYTIVEDQRSAFEEAYHKAGDLLQTSSYRLGYELTHGVDEPQHYIVRIHWTSIEDHLNGFRKSKEFGSFFNLVKPFYTSIEEMKHYTTTSIVWNKP
jgi:heme-degrading monooxygenase HmoA